MHELIYFLSGTLVGSINAISGGGMLIGFPIMLGLGIPPLIANATANVAVTPGNLSAAYSYRYYLKKIPRTYLLLLIPTIIGAAIGAILLRNTSFSKFDQIIPGLILFAVILFAFQPLLYNQIHRHIHSPKKNRNQIKPLISIGLAILPLAIYGGYFGAGLGFILLAFLGFTKLHDHIHRMNALRTTLTSAISIVSVICLASSHLINWKVGLTMGLGNFVGGYFGAQLIQKFSPNLIRVVIVIIGITTATYLGLRSY